MSNVSMIDGHIDEPKVTDEKIIEDWEKILLMGDAPIGKYWQVGITTKLAKDTFDMLNYQQAEIERLYKEVDRLSQCVMYHDGVVSDLEKDIANAKTKAIKEFADKYLIQLGIYENYCIETRNECARDTVLQMAHEFQEFVKEVAGV